MKYVKCPDCGNFLKDKVNCKCGWKEANVEIHEVDERCQYHYGNRRCLLPGTISPFPYGKSGPWFCVRHWQHRNDDTLQEPVNYQEYLQERTDWRNFLFPEELRIKKNKKKNSGES